MASKKSNMDWKIWGKKVGVEFLKVLVAGAIVIWQQDLRFAMVLPLLKAIENYLKHM